MADTGCGLSGLWPFRFVAVSVLAIPVCGRYDQKLLSVAVSGVVEHMQLGKGLDMVDKAGVGEKMYKSEMT